MSLDDAGDDPEMDNQVKAEAAPAKLRTCRELCSMFRNAAVMFVFSKAPRAGVPFTGLMHSQNNLL